MIAPEVPYSMFPSTTPPKPRIAPGTRVLVEQFVRVGHRRWKTQVTGTVLGEGIRPVGGMEMGAKARYGYQPTLTLRQDDGELTVVAVDDQTAVRPLDAHAAQPTDAP